MTRRIIISFRQDHQSYYVRSNDFLIVRMHHCSPKCIPFDFLTAIDSSDKTQLIQSRIKLCFPMHISLRYWTEQECRCFIVYQHHWYRFIFWWKWKRSFVLTFVSRHVLTSVEIMSNSSVTSSSFSSGVPTRLWRSISGNVSLDHWSKIAEKVFILVSLPFFLFNVLCIGKQCPPSEQAFSCNTVQYRCKLTNGKLS